MSKERGQVKINIRADEKERFDDLCSRLEASQVSTATKVFRWFVAQPETLQRAILGLYGPLTPDITKEILTRLAADSDTGRGKDITERTGRPTRRAASGSQT